jgi:hypothetical protein
MKMGVSDEDLHYDDNNGEGSSKLVKSNQSHQQSLKVSSSQSALVGKLDSRQIMVRYPSFTLPSCTPPLD